MIDIYYWAFIFLLNQFCRFNTLGFSPMIRLFSSLFYEDDITTNQHYQKQTRFLSLSLLVFVDVFANIRKVLQ